MEDHKLPYWVNIKSTPIVNENGDVLGERIPSRYEVGDDVSKVVIKPIIHLSDVKDAAAFAAQMALLNDKASVCVSGDSLDPLDVINHVNQFKN